MDSRGKGILLIGGGGHCKSVLCSLLNERKYDRIGIVDAYSNNAVLSIQVVGKDEDLLQLHSNYSDAFIATGSIGDTALRRKLYAMAMEIGYHFPNIIDPTAVVSPYTTLGHGVYIGKRAVVNAGTNIGDCAILNTGCIVEHDCNIGDFSHIAPGAVLCGNVCVGRDAHVGSNAVVIQGIKINEGTVIGAGSTVVRDAAAGIVAVGNPCREIGKNGN